MSISGLIPRTAVAVVVAARRGSSPQESGEVKLKFFPKASHIFGMLESTRLRNMVLKDIVLPSW